MRTRRGNRSDLLVRESARDERGRVKQKLEVLYDQTCDGNRSDNAVGCGSSLDGAWATDRFGKARAGARSGRYLWVPGRLRVLPRLQREYGLRPVSRVLPGVCCSLN